MNKEQKYKFRTWLNKRFCDIAIDDLGIGKNWEKIREDVNATNK